MLTTSTQVNHSTLVENVTPFNENMRAMAGAAGRLSLQGLAGIDAEVTRQAASIGYLNDFRITLWLSFAAIPLVLLLRTKKPKPAAGQAPPSSPPEPAPELALE